MKHIFILLLTLVSTGVWAASPTPSADISIYGHVRDEVDGEPLIGVTLRIMETGQGTVTDVNGYYHLDNLPHKCVTLQVTYVGHQTIIREIDLNTSAQIDLTMKESNATINEVVVTGLTGQQLIKDSPTPISFLSASDLKAISSSNIIDAIAHQPGISQITTGSGISKPVIRGLGYNRIVTVNDGIRQEGQQWGDEHGIEIDAQSVAEVEVLKGPASLMYGSDAMAGVVIFSDEPVQPIGKKKVEASTEYQSNNNLMAYSLGFMGNEKGNVWNLRYSEKMAQAYKNKLDGRVLGSQFHERALKAMAGVNRSWGYSHLLLSQYMLEPSLIEGERDPDTGHFVLSAPDDHEDEGLTPEAETEVRPASHHDLHTYRHGMPYQHIDHLKAVSESNVYLGRGSLKAIVGYQLNRRQEFEEAETPHEAGLDFRLHTVNYNFTYQLSEHQTWKLATGIGGMWQRSLNRGDEFLIPAYRLTDIGAFATSSYRMGRLNLSGGLRLDHRYLKGYALEDHFTPFSRHFNGLTGSLGAVCAVTGNLYLRANAARGFRAPNMSELGSNGMHEGTFRYEVGNHALKAEYSWQFDLGLDLSSPMVSAQAALFASLIDNYIFLERNAESHQSPSDAQEPLSAPVYSFTQGDARLVGGELSIDFHPVERLHIENTFCWVNAVQLHQPRESRYLPFTPPARWTSELRYNLIRDGRTLNNTFAKIETECNLRQTHVHTEGGTETPTPSYTLVNAQLGTDVKHHGHTAAHVYLTAQNLFDRAYQSHLSRLKYADENPVTGRRGVFNMGRNLILKLVVPVSW